LYQFNFLSEYAGNGSIYDYIHVDCKQPPLSQSLVWATQVVEGTVIIPQS